MEQQTNLQHIDLVDSRLDKAQTCDFLRTLATTEHIAETIQTIKLNGSSETMGSDFSSEESSTYLAMLVADAPHL